MFVVDAGRIEWLLAAIRGTPADDKTIPERICVACVEAMPVDGAALSLMAEEGHRESVASSDETAAMGEELEVTLGEGPGVEAFASGRPVLVADIGGPDRATWPTFADGLAAIGTRAVFAFPLQLGAVRLGILTLTRQSPGSLSADDLADALRVSDVTALLLLGRKGQLVEDFDERWLDGSTRTPEVHQATGMLISQLGIGAEEAFVRLRAFAFAADLELSQVAGRVIARRLTFSEEDA